MLPDSVVVERVDSSRARIASVLLRDHVGGLKVSGRLQKRYRGRSPIPGHLHIEAIAPDGTLLEEVVSNYRPLSRNTGTSEFSRRLTVHPDRVSRVRVTHHPHDDDPPKSGTPAGSGLGTEIGDPSWSV